MTDFDQFLPQGQHSGAGLLFWGDEPAAAPDPEISPAVAKQLAAMQAEIEQLKAELKSRSAG